MKNRISLIEELLDLNVELAHLKELDQFLRRVVNVVRKMSDAEGVTIYLKSEDDRRLDFYVVYNEKLGVFLSGEQAREWHSVPLYNEDGDLNLHMVAAVCALQDRIINIEDVYETTEFDFSGTKRFDKLNGYRSKSMLVIPMKSHEGEIIGVLQLINKKSGGAFTKRDERYIEALAAHAATAITKTMLIQELEDLLESFLQTIAVAVDEKSKFTSDHIKRVAFLMEEFIDRVNVTSFMGKSYSQEERKKLLWAAWMHDIGKIVTPEHILNKATKLQKICDRIEMIRLKFALYESELRLALVQKRVSQEEFEERLNEAKVGLQRIESINEAKSDLSLDDRKILERFRNMFIKIDGIKVPLIDKEEFENLTIFRGTLTQKEREIINNHAVVSKKMLSTIKFPKKYRDVAHIAASHHERLDGSGYPDGLKADALSFEDRLLGVLDIFEALSAPDRPYKKALTIDEIKMILYAMVEDGKLDGAIVDFLFSSQIAHKYMQTLTKKCS